MPTFAPGSSHTATVPITVAPAGIECSAEFFLGPNDTTKLVTAQRTFTSTGGPQNITFTLVMPSGAQAGVSMNPYCDVFAGGFLIIGIVGTEAVLVPSGTIGPITWT